MAIWYHARNEYPYEAIVAGVVVAQFRTAADAKIFIEARNLRGDRVMTVRELTETLQRCIEQNPDDINATVMLWADADIVAPLTNIWADAEGIHLSAEE